MLPIQTECVQTRSAEGDFLQSSDAVYAGLILR